MQRVHLDGDLGLRGQLALCALTLRSQPPNCALVARGVRLVLPAEFVDAMTEEPIVEVLAAEVRVARRRLDLEDALLDGEERDVKGAAAEVKDEDVPLRAAVVVLLVEAVSDRGRGGLVDDAHAVDARDDGGVFGRLALGVVEVGGDRDHRVLDLLAEVRLRDLLHLGEDHRRDLLRGERLRLAVELNLDHGLLRLARDEREGEIFGIRLHLRV
mmetsp:Transcript_151552/g.368045  ORF Transcript_151552/g.368045 Transcript_151552/m.368045 type:complete len:214 (+) Transcript_151552:1170-1811(+)